MLLQFLFSAMNAPEELGERDPVLELFLIY